VTKVLLIYPFLRSRVDRSRFRFPPLGVAYLAAALREAGHAVELLDCTFMSRREALDRALAARADIVGISCLVTMQDDALWFAGHLRPCCDLLIAGGPLPTCSPERFLESFDLVVRGEGEATLIEIVAAFESGADPADVPGTVRGNDRATRSAPAAAGPGCLPAPRPDSVAAACRPFTRDLNAIPFPARDLLPNDAYLAFGRRRYGFGVTTVLSTRGCPYACEFCSNVVFGNSYRERSVANVVDEIEDVLRLGYERVSFADDVFTMNRARVLAVCAEIRRRGLRFDWECLARVDGFEPALAREMRRAGCRRVFFGIESGNDEILRLMRKGITTAQARAAVLAAAAAGLQTGAFFILCYPGETDDTVLETLRFATSLPLDYVGLTMPYPLPGTDLERRVGESAGRPWDPRRSPVLNQVLIYDGDFSALKMRFAIVKGHTQVMIRRRFGRLAPAALALVERPSDALFRRLR